jgi:hypothetical protein
VLRVCVSGALLLALLFGACALLVIGRLTIAPHNAHADGVLPAAK